MEHELISHYKEKELIDDRILFVIGMTELTSTSDLVVTLGSGLSPFERINAIGLNGNKIVGYKMKYNHLTTMLFSFSFDEIKVFNIKKKLFGKLVFEIATETLYYQYKITANKNLIYKIQEYYNEYVKENDNIEI